MTRRKKLIWIQIILGIAFLLQPILLPVRPDNLERFVFSKEVAKNILANAFIIAFFYFNFYWLIPKFYFTKKYVPYFLIVITCFLMTLLISTTFTSQVPTSREQNPPPHFEFDRELLNRSFISEFRFFFTENDQIFFLFGTVVLFSLLLKVNNRYYKTENAKQETEINYLLAQINPHFLFNALNSIYTLTIKEKASKSSTSLLKLSGLMRYIITEVNQNIVPLEKEINCISDFIDLQKLRLTDNVKLNYSVSGNSLGKKIAPMLLIPFIENAFKHGVNPDENSAIIIQVDITDDMLVLEVRNNKVFVNNDTIGKSGLGVKNAKNRLTLLYPNKHDLQISEDDKEYHITLKIQI